MAKAAGFDFQNNEKSDCFAVTFISTGKVLHSTNRGDPTNLKRIPASIISVAKGEAATFMLKPQIEVGLSSFSASRAHEVTIWY
jgi:hypothetical protein